MAAPVSVGSINDTDTFSPGDWTVQASCDVGSRPVVVQLLTNQVVNDGDVIPLLAKEQTLTIPFGGALVVTTTGTDEEVIVDESLGRARGQFDARSSPAFGVGTQVLTTPTYRLTIDITIIP